MTKDAPKQTSGLAIAGLVLAILSAATSFLPIINNLSFFLALIGAALSLVALIGAKRGKHTATGMSLAGLIVSVVAVAIVLVTQAAYSSALDSVAESLKTDDAPVATTEAKTTDATEEAAPAQEEAPAEQPAPAEEAPSEEAPAEQDYSALAVGQGVAFDSGLTVAVVGVQRGLTKYDGSPVTCITVTYTNSGDGTESFNVFDWKGEDANGVQRSSTFVSDSTNELHSGSLAPGGTVTGNVYLEGDVTRAIYVENIFTDRQVGWVL